MSEIEVPKGWKQENLENIVLNGKKSIKRGPWGSSIKKDFFVPNGNKIYQQHNVIYNDFEYGHYFIDDIKFEELKEFEVKPGDFLISCSGTIGKVARIPNDAKKGIMNQALLKITIDEEKILPNYFLYLLNSKLIQDQILSKGSAMKNVVAVKELKKIKVLIPETIDEQKKIIHKLDNVLGQLEEKKKEILNINQKNTIAIKFFYKNLNRAISQHYIPLEIPQNWTIKKLFELSDVGQGGTPSTSHSEYWDGDIPWLRSGELLDNIITDSRKKITKKGLQNSSTKLCPKGTIMIAMTGQGLTRGRTCLLGIDSCANQSCAHIINNSQDILTEFLWAFLKSRYWFIRSIHHGSGQPGINVSLIKQLDIAFPSITEQNKILTKLRSEKTIETWKSYLEKSLKQSQLTINHLNNLSSSILDRAFSGKLVN